MTRAEARRRLAAGGRAYLLAFTKYVQGKPLTEEEQRALNATGGTAATGYPVPLGIDPSYQRAERERSD